MACLLFLLARFSASWLSAPTLPDPPTSCAYATAHAKEGPTEGPSTKGKRMLIWISLLLLCYVLPLSFVVFSGSGSPCFFLLGKTSLA